MRDCNLQTAHGATHCRREFFMPQKRGSGMTPGFNIRTKIHSNTIFVRMLNTESLYRDTVSCRPRGRFSRRDGWMVGLRMISDRLIMNEAEGPYPGGLFSCTDVGLTGGGNDGSRGSGHLFVATGEYIFLERVKAWSCEPCNPTMCFVECIWHKPSNASTTEK